MQNAVDHAFPEAIGRRARRGDAARAPTATSRSRCATTARACPSEFTLDGSRGLGLSIVQALVTSELQGSIEMHDDNGTSVRVRVPGRDAARRAREPVAAGRSGYASRVAELVAATSRPLRSRRRSSSVVPPQTPASWFVASANSRHWPRHRALVADLLGRVDLVEREAGRPDREEQLGAGVATRCPVAPVLGVPVVGSDPGQRHFASPLLGRIAPACPPLACAPDHKHPHMPDSQGATQANGRTVAAARGLTRTFAPS